MVDEATPWLELEGAPVGDDPAWTPDPGAIEDRALTVTAPDGSQGSLPGIDTDQDGLVDTAELDLVGNDGRPDSLVFDTNHDGVGDTIVADTDHDGLPDRVLRDWTQSGTWQDVGGPVAGAPQEQPADAPQARQPVAGPALENDELVIVARSGERQTVSGFDTDNDGAADGAELDTTGDGVPDTFLLDTDRDGVVDHIVADTDGDDRAERVLQDRTGTGQWEDVTAEFNDYDARHQGEFEPAMEPTASAPGTAPTTVDPAGDPRSSSPSTGTITVTAPDGTQDSVAGVDTNADGIADTAALDENRDGRIETWVVDSDQDGRADRFALDNTGDGTPDITLVDASETGKWVEDTSATPHDASEPGAQPADATPSYETVFPDPANGDIYLSTVARMDRQAEEIWWTMTRQPVPTHADGTPLNGNEMYLELVGRTSDPDMQKELLTLAETYFNLIKKGLSWG